MGWAREDLPGHEGYVGVRLTGDVGEDPDTPGQPPRAGDVVGHTTPAVLAAGVDATVPACTCGWRGVAVPAGEVEDVEAVWDAAYREWLEVHAAALLAAAELDRDVARVLDRLTAFADERPVYALVVLKRLADAGDALTLKAVRNARGAEPPVTWEELGDALGVTRQAASGRFGPALRRLSGSRAPFGDA